MLQINSGKLYTRGVGRVNALRGVLYTNLQLRFFPDIETVAGTMRQTDGPPGNRAIVYELEERIELTEDGPGVLASHLVDPFLRDFAALASFGLRGIVAPQAALVDRLCSPDPGLASYHPPRQFVRRYFDEEVRVSAEEIAGFVAFTDQLIALDRKSFLAAMRAIRTFVAGIHRLRDDLALSYALLVSAIESLAQDFSGDAMSWDDVEERKRTAIDVALEGATSSTAKKVRAAVLSCEHPSLARRYRVFALRHIDGEFFRSTDARAGSAVGRHELDEALRQAYAVRSRYLHNLLPLPDALRLPPDPIDVTDVERRPTLTLQGLVRLTHHVITTFVLRGRRVDREPYDYHREQAGVIIVPLAAEMWVGAPLQHPRDGRRRLEGLLEQMVPVLCGIEKPTVTDLRPIFPDIERLIRSANAGQRRALLTLYSLFATIIPRHDRSAILEDQIRKYAVELAAPSSEALLARTLFGNFAGWSLEDHQRALDTYLAERVKPKGLHAPRLLDAVLLLALADRYRLARQNDQAREMISLAVEVYPGDPRIIEMEQQFRSGRIIPWREKLLPRLVKPRTGRKKRTRQPGTAAVPAP